MRYKLLGRSGLRVSELCLGTMGFGTEWQWGCTKDEAQKIFNLFTEAGGNFIDTANLYTAGTSERFLGEFMATNREQIVLATKYTLSTTTNDPNSAGNQRKNMIQAVEASLKRLGTDYIDLYYLHAWDFATPVDEVMRAFDDLVKAGKVLYVGISDAPAWVVSQANTLAELRGWSRFVGLQLKYSLLERTPERELLPMAKAFDIAVTAWSPIAAGVLTGKYLKGITSKRIASNSQLFNEHHTEIVKEVVKIAEEIGCQPVHVALNWLRQRNQVIIPIIGVTKSVQMEDCIKSLDYKLNNEQMERLDDISQIVLGFPHDFLRSENIVNVVYGGMRDKIDIHH